MSSLVSIIIPTHNRAQLLRTAVDSCLSQTYRNMEVIVVDDGSDDETLDILAAYGAAVKVEYQSNAGAPAARNRGLELAAGEFVKFLDSDDLLMPTAIAAQVRRYDKYPAPTGVVITGHHTLTDLEVSNQRRVRPRLQVRLRGEFRLPDIISRNPPTSSPLYRRKQLQEVGGFAEDALILQDYEIAYRVAVSGYKYRYYPDDIYRMRTHDAPSRVSMQTSDEKVRYQVDLIQQQYDLLKALRPDLCSRSVDSAFSRRAAGIIRRFIRWGRQSEAEELIEFMDRSLSTRSVEYHLARARCRAGLVSLGR